MRYAFYDSVEYRRKQSLATKATWKKGFLDFLYKRDKRNCLRKECGKDFETTPSNPKLYCSRNCSAVATNSGRYISEETRTKISNSLKLRGIRPPSFGKIKVPRAEILCQNQKCKKSFLVERWMRRKFCSVQCAMEVIGKRPTSPRASRGKAGIRKDISDIIYFYSRWEANVARVYTYLGIEWAYAPTSFDLKKQTYTPDFYLPKTNIYVEVKNFWWKYSKERDEKFRKLYPTIKLEIISKIEYTDLEKQYAKSIPTWEYRNSVFPLVSPK